MCPIFEAPATGWALPARDLAFLPKKMHFLPKI
jgi:hypothetical protein